MITARNHLAGNAPLESGEGDAGGEDETEQERAVAQAAGSNGTPKT